MSAIIPVPESAVQRARRALRDAPAEDVAEIATATISDQTQERLARMRERPRDGGGRIQ